MSVLFYACVYVHLHISFYHICKSIGNEFIYAPTSNTVLHVCNIVQSYMNIGIGMLYSMVGLPL